MNRPSKAAVITESKISKVGIYPGGRYAETSQIANVGRHFTQESLEWPADRARSRAKIVDSNPRESTASLSLDRLEVIVRVNLSLIGQKKAPTRHLIGWPVEQ